MEVKVRKITIPDGWEIDKIDNGEIILKEVKKELPKTWKECYKRLGRGESIDSESNVSELCRLSFPFKENHNVLPVGLGRPLLALCQLLVCREVYRDGWKPDWKDSVEKHYIKYYDDEIGTDIKLYESAVLSFQSEEIRDQFLENFRDLIEEAKELI